jgi:hypothetical protein
MTGDEDHGDAFAGGQSGEARIAPMTSVILCTCNQAGFSGA